MSNTTLVSWTFPEYTQHQRKKGWYVWATLIFLALLAYAIFSANFLFGLILILVVIILFTYHHREPLEINFEISGDGILIGERQFDYKDFKKFWLVYEPPAIKNLYLEQTSPFKPVIVIPLQNENPVKVRKFLKEVLTEDLEKESESTTEALGRIFKI
jgi:hypothetical protein